MRLLRPNMAALYHLNGKLQRAYSWRNFFFGWGGGGGGGGGGGERGTIFLPEISSMVIKILKMWKDFYLVYSLNRQPIGHSQGCKKVTQFQHPAILQFIFLLFLFFIFQKAVCSACITFDFTLLSCLY